MLRRSFLACFILAFFVVGCKSKRPSSLHKDRARAKTERPTKVETPTDRSRESRVVDTKGDDKRDVPVNMPYNTRVENYINQFSGIAQEEMKQYGIPASIKLAQGILESGAGAGELAVKSNNHFGIKCHQGWEGGRVYHDDDERGECFRKYNDPKYSYRDHSLFLTQRSRYQDLFKLRKDDYKGWARGLRKAGYATDPRYPEKLIGIIERYNLQKYDDQVLGNRIGKQDEPDETKIGTYAVQMGDTLYSISRRFNLTVETLKNYNGLKNNDISIGQILYLHPVKN